LEVIHWVRETRNAPTLPGNVIDRVELMLAKMVERMRTTEISNDGRAAFGDGPSGTRTEVVDVRDLMSFV